MSETLDLGTRREPDAFDALSATCQSHFDKTLLANGPQLFTVDAGDLWAVYLDGLAPEHRQHHTCSCCRGFVRRYGSLASIGPDGSVRPAVWPADAAPAPYAAAVAAMARAVRRGRVTGVFRSAESVWGTPWTGGWTHFALRPPSGAVQASRRSPTPGQVMAAKFQDFATLSRGLVEFSRAHVAQAVTLLESNSLYRGERVAGPAHFLLQLHDAIQPARGAQVDNLIWKAVASAPFGFCTPRSGMVGTLLEDIAAGLPFEDVERKFAAKMHPLQYQRPQAAPSAGNIAVAEKRFAELGLAPALRRRYARLEEIKTVWRPERVQPAASEGIFGHLKPKAASRSEPMTTPAKPITWEKFQRTVLPGAKSIEVLLSQSMSFCGLLTASDPEAPPILQWDHVDDRNPVSWYVWHGGSAPSQWGLMLGAWAPVTAVALLPCLWSGPERYTYQGKGAVFILSGAKDTRSPGLGLFPEILKSEIHAVRKTIEAHSRAGTPDGREEGTANGLLLGAGSAGGTPYAPLRVTSAKGTALWCIDRWD